MAVTEDYTAADTKVYAFAERYRSSAELRARIDSGDVSEALNELGVSLRDGVEARIVENTDEVVYFAMPPDPNASLSDEKLQFVSGGAGRGLGPSGCASSASTFPSCLGCASSVSSRDS